MTLAQPTRVVLDMTALQGEHAPERGIARYVLETTRALVRRGAPIAMLGFSPLRPIPDHVPEDLLAMGVAGWHTQRTFESMRQQGPVVLHVFSPFELMTPFDALYVPAASAPGAATTATVYDAIPHTDRERYLTFRLARERYESAARHLAACDRSFAISRHAARQAVEHLGVEPSRVGVVGTGGSHFFQPVAHTGDQWPILLQTAPAVARGCILTVSGDEPRKNVEALIDAVAALPPEVRAGRQLVQVGAISPESAARWRARATERGLRDEDLVLLGRVDDLTLRGLYQGCDLFVFPSLEEGFGLPVLEAARCGAVVVTSDRTAVPEVLDDPESVFDAMSVDSMTDRIAAALADAALRHRLTAAAQRAVHVHTWDAVADRMIEAWAEMPVASVDRAPRRHIAVIGRFERGAVADGPVARSNLALAEALSSHGTVTCFDVRHDAPVESRTTVAVRPLAVVGDVTSLTAFDHVVHLLDPTPSAAALDAVRSTPGVIVTGAGAAARGYAGWPVAPTDQQWLDAELAVDGAQRLHRALRTKGRVGATDVPEGRPFGSLPLLRRAVAVAAHSSRDASLLAMELGPFASAVRVEVVPPATHAVAASTSTSASAIVIIGRVDGWQWTVQHLRTTMGQDIELLDVDGAASADADRRWMELLRRASCVVLLDHDAPSDHLHWALEALASGVPVATTGSWAAALPDGAVRRLEADVSNVTMYAHIAALAQPSPLRREQLARAQQFNEARTMQHRGDDLAALLDARSVPPMTPLPRRTFPEIAVTSAVCRMADFDSPVFTRWCADLGEAFGARRKLWEYIAIAAALERRGCLVDGARGLGFGVGTEPLTAAFAARGCRVTATDLDADRAEASDWAPSGQLAAQLADLNLRGLCDPVSFAALVEFRAVDMTAIPSDLDGGYDFCWSSCAFEHLGSIERGLQFVVDSVRTLRPGGVAVHTTELVLSSDTRTLESGNTVLFRESDLHDLVDRLERDGHRVAPLDLVLGDELLDRHVDAPPFSNEPHLKLELGGHITTSFAIIVERG